MLKWLFKSNKPDKPKKTIVRLSPEREKRLMKELRDSLHDQYVTIIRQEANKKLNEVVRDAEEVLYSRLRHEIESQILDQAYIEIVASHVVNKVRKNIAKDYAYKILTEEELI